MQIQEKSVDAFVKAVENKRRRADAETLIDLMTRITGHAPRMWGDTLIGFDQYHCKYDSGREGGSFVTGFSPRKANLVIYITNGFKKYRDILERIGKHKSSVSCLYINKLADVDMGVLEELITRSYADMKAKYHNQPTRA